MIEGKKMNVRPYLQRLLEVLPLIAEEGPYSEVVAESELLAKMGESRDEIAKATALAMVRAIFESMELLDRRLLGKGEWGFISFPASLAGRSLLATLSTPDQTLFEQNYWEQGAHRPTVIEEEQRKFLQLLEGRREKFHPTEAAFPIRTVHVAWGVIKIGGMFLMHLREDKKRPHDKNYVFPGGRLNLSDLPVESQNASSLRDLFGINSVLAEHAIPSTLARELEEECGLLKVQHYGYGTPLRLPPHVQVEGARNNHALTQYNVVVYPIQLTDDGELKLLQTENEYVSEFAWFSIDDLFRLTRIDGKRAFVDALSRAKGLDGIEWLTNMQDSSAIPYSYDSESDAIDVPGEVGGAFAFGKSGKETPKEVDLDIEEWGLLALLAWHGKKLQVTADSEQICLLGNGWVRLLTPEILQHARRLAGKMTVAGLPVPKLRSDMFCRLDVDPPYLFLDRKLFSYELPEGDDKQRMVLRLASVKTPWGELHGASKNFDLSRNMVRIVRAIECGEDPTAEARDAKRGIKAGDVPKQIRESFQLVRTLGLRMFVSNTKGDGFRILVDPSPQ
jgi:8-oxo-dGTP pyrophosphatase MutT (NUDIX family)